MPASSTRSYHLPDNVQDLIEVRRSARFALKPGGGFRRMAAMLLPRATTASNCTELTNDTQKSQTERAAGHQSVHPEHARPIPGSGREWLILYRKPLGGAHPQLPG